MYVLYRDWSRHGLQLRRWEQLVTQKVVYYAWDIAENVVLEVQRNETGRVDQELITKDLLVGLRGLKFILGTPGTLMHLN